MARLAGSLGRGVGGEGAPGRALEPAPSLPRLLRLAPPSPLSHKVTAPRSSSCTDLGPSCAGLEREGVTSLRICEASEPLWGEETLCLQARPPARPSPADSGGNENHLFLTVSTNHRAAIGAPCADGR